MSNWPRVRIRDVSEKITVGFVGSMSKYFVDKGVPLLRGQNIRPFSLNLANLKFIPHEIHEKWRKSSLEAGDVVIVRVGYPGIAAVIPSGLGPLNAASLVIVRTDKSKLDPAFLANVLNSPWGKATVQGRLVGAAQQVFNTNTAADFEIPFPPIRTQHRIASVLSAYDDLIENNTRSIAILEEMAKRLYEEWFVQFRFPGHEGVKMVESEIGPLPEGWEHTRLGDLASEVRDAVDPSSVPPETPYVGLEHIPRRSITLSLWGDPASVESTKLKFHRGEILFGKIRPYFHKVSIAPFDGICSSDTIVIRPAEQRWLPMVLCCTSSDRFVDHSSQTSQGTKMPRANWGVLTEYPLPTPPEDLLQQFNGFVEAIVNQTQNLMHKNTNLRAQRDILLPKLISGEIDVSGVGKPAVEAAE